MTVVEVILSASSVAIAGAGLWYVQHVVRTSGRDRPRDPEAVDRLVERAKRLPETSEALAERRFNETFVRVRGAVDPDTDLEI